MSYATHVSNDNLGNNFYKKFLSNVQARSWSRAYLITNDNMFDNITFGSLSRKEDEKEKEKNKKSATN